MGTLGGGWTGNARVGSVYAGTGPTGSRTKSEGSMGGRWGGGRGSRSGPGVGGMDGGAGTRNVEAS